MFCAGDEFMNTQLGNNNPYNQDNETTWLNWDLLRANADVFRFFRMMIAFRKRHPSIGRSRFWREDVNWYGVEGVVDWGPASKQLAYCLHGASQGDEDLYVMINADAEGRSFQIQERPAGGWRRVVDTSLPPPEDIVEEPVAPVVTASEYPVAGRSVVVLVGRRPSSQPRLSVRLRTPAAARSPARPDQATPCHGGGLHRLRQVGVEAGLQDAQAIVLPRVGGHRDDGKPSLPLAVSIRRTLLDQLVAVVAGHADVREHHVRPLAPQGLQRSLGRGRPP